MSRCFPFPPPGYERQTRTDPVDSLAKEKQKEKKRKKENDKEKREGKEKKERDRSKDKHKDKKDRKEKHRDKTKKEKDKNPPEGVRADKQNEPNHHELGECSQKTKDTSHSKFSEDLDRRIKDEQKVAASRMVENFSDPSHRSIGNTASPNSLVNRVAGHRIVQSSSVDSQKRNDSVEWPANNLLHSVQRTDVAFANAVQKEKNTSQKMAPKFEQKGHALSFANAMPKQKNTSQKVAPKLESKGDILGLGNVAQKEHFAGQRLAPNIDQKVAAGTEPSQLNSKVSIRKSDGLTVAASVEKHNKIKSSDSSSVSFVQRTINGTNQPAHALSNLPQENTSLLRISTKIEKKIDAEKHHSLAGQKDVDGMGQLMERDRTDNREVQGRKEKKQKDRDHKKHKSKHKHKEKDKEKDKTKERKKKERDKLTDNGKEDQTDGLKLNPLAPQEDDRKNQIDGPKLKPLAAQADDRSNKIDGPKLKPLAAQADDRKNQINSPKLKPLAAQADDTKNQIDGLKSKSLAAQADDTKNLLSNDRIKKRKEIETNGFLHENDPRLNKFPKTSPSFHHPVENGRRFEVSPVTTNCLSMKPEATNKTTAGMLPVDSKNHVMNGISEAQPLSACMRHPDTTDIRVADGVLSEPHPDEKYLSQIYSVPKMELREYDDQEWLFSTSQSQQKRQLTREDVEPSQVWAEALRVESDDVIAMPYVIPF